MKSITDEDGFIQFIIPPGADETEGLINEIKMIVINEGLFIQANYPFTTKPNFSTLGSIIKISPQEPIISFMFDDSVRDPWGFHAITLYEEYNLSYNLVDILSFYNLLLETNIAQTMIFRGKRSGIIHKWAMTVDTVYKYKEKIAGGISLYMMENKDFDQSVSYKFKKCKQWFGFI